MTARDNGAARVGGGWRREVKTGWRKGAKTSMYELADGTAKIVKTLDTDSNRQVWWAWLTDPESDLEKFRTLREATQYIEKLLDGRQQ